MPSTATIEATPIAIPSADSAARARRVRSPSAPVRSTSPAVTAASPSRSSTRRGNASAIAWSCVIVTIVEPAACSSCSSARMPAPERLSRLPVGSSANTIAGRPTSARAIATRWRSPPDSFDGECSQPVLESDGLQRLARPRPPLAAAPRRRTAARSRRCPARSSRRAGRTAGTRTRSPARAAPPARARRASRCRRRRPRTVPALGRSSVPMTCRSVDLPEPDGPTTATASPASHVERDAAQRVDAARIGLGHAVELEHGHSAVTTCWPSRRPSPSTSTMSSAYRPGLDVHRAARRSARPRSRRPGARAAPSPARPARPCAARRRTRRRPAPDRGVPERPRA